MKRRDVLKSIPAAAAIPAVLAGGVSTPSAAAAQTATAGSTAARDPASAETFGIPDFAQHMLTSDMEGLGPDGKPTGQKSTFTGASKANATAQKAAQHQMTLTDEEQAILDGKEGKEKAKLMKILVAFGNAFGAEGDASGREGKAKAEWSTSKAEGNAEEEVASVIRWTLRKIRVGGSRTDPFQSGRLEVDRQRSFIALRLASRRPRGVRRSDATSFAKIGRAHPYVP